MKIVKEKAKCKCKIENKLNLRMVYKLENEEALAFASWNLNICVDFAMSTAFFIRLDLFSFVSQRTFLISFLS